MQLNSGTVNADLRAAFLDWRSRSADHARAYDRIDALWLSPELAQALEQSVPAVPDFPARQAKRPAGGHWRMGLAAGVAAAGLIVWQGPELILRSQADFLTEIGTIESHDLPDGSTMTLNTGSAVSIDFANGRRHVTLLRGEAFFDVQRDLDHPFTVSGLSSEVTVTGTEFSLKSGTSEDTLTVAEGHVLFRGVRQSGQVEVNAGQAAEAGAATRPVPAAVDIAQAVSWRAGRIAIVDVPLWRALDELQRYRGTPIVLATLDRRDLTVAGDFRTDDIDGAVASLAAVAGLSTMVLPGSILLVY